jgi:hypothetical protein
MSRAPKQPWPGGPGGGTAPSNPALWGHRALWPVLDMMDNRQAVDHMTTLETDALTLAKQPFLILFAGEGLVPLTARGSEGGSLGKASPYPGRVWFALPLRQSAVGRSVGRKGVRRHSERPTGHVHSSVLPFTRSWLKASRWYCGRKSAVVPMVQQASRERF